MIFSRLPGKITRPRAWLTAALALVVAVGLAATAGAATAGSNTPASFRNVDNNFGVGWSNVSSAGPSDNAYATAVLNSGNRDSDFLRATSTGFSIPSGATINGIEVEVEHSASAANLLRTDSVQLLKSGAPAGTGFDGTGGAYNWGTADVTSTFGGSADLWGTTWTPADINSANFGVSFAARHSQSGPASTARVDRIGITVYYTPAAPATGTLTVTKIVVGGTAVVGDFPLTLDGLSITSGVATTTVAGAHQVAEVSSGSYGATWGGDCNSSGQVTVPASGAASCTLTNTYIAPTGTLTVDKVVVGGPMDDSEFALFVDGQSVTDEVATTTVAGTHTVTETGAQYYVATWGETCPGGVVSVPASGSVTCTLTNTYNPPTTGAIEVLKNVVAQNGTTDVDDSTTFTVSINGATSTTFGEGLSAVFAGLAPGDYTIGELAQAGYQLIGISPSTTTTVVAGATTTVTVTNRQMGTTGDLTVTKVVVNNGVGTKSAEDFNLYVDGLSITSGVATTTVAGDHTVTEDSFPGYQASWSEGCEGGVVAVPVEGSASCTLTNTWVGTGVGTLTVTKVVVNGDFGTLAVEDFPLFVDESPVSSGVAATTTAGTHVVSETSAPGYSAAFSGDCDASGNVTVPSDGSASCTITNTYATTGGLVIVKNVVAEDGESDVEDGTSFSVQLDGGEPMPIAEGEGIEISGLAPGEYAVTELEREGYVLVSVSPASATVVAGATTTVTVTNRQVAGGDGTLVIVKNVIGEDGESDVVDGGQFTVVVDGGAGIWIDEANPVVIEDVEAGDHVVTELAQDGYALVSVEPAVVTVPVGGTATVTVTNRRLPTPAPEAENSRPRRGGHRHPVGSVLGASTDGEVLGASTDSCQPYLTGFVWKDRPNDSAVVAKLQEYLNAREGAGLTVSGVYDEATQAAVGAYQLKYWDAIMRPWFGDADPRTPTYNVFLTTRWHINNVECPGGEPFPAL